MEAPNQHGSKHDNQRASGPDTPEVLEYLTVGFNSTTRYLEALAQRSITRDKQKQGPAESEPDLSRAFSTDSKNLRSMAAIFVPRSDQPTILYSHLPLLIKAASFVPFSSSAPRLVTLPKGAQERLADALSIPRVGLVGLIDGAPNGNLLMEVVKQKVLEVEVPWLTKEGRGVYTPVNIKAVQTCALVDQKSNEDQLPWACPAAEDE